MVVDPVVISTTGFVVNYSVILETVLFQPRLGNLGVLTQTTSEESDDMAFFVPAIDDFDHVGKDLSGRHPFVLLIGDVLTHGTVDVDKEILAPLWKSRLLHFRLLKLPFLSWKVLWIIRLAPNPIHRIPLTPLFNLILWLFCSLVGLL